jgi:hypothetical protein
MDLDFIYDIYASTDYDVQKKKKKHFYCYPTYWIHRKTVRLNFFRLSDGLLIISSLHTCV